jgi:hypothetical protein
MCRQLLGCEQGNALLTHSQAQHPLFVVCLRLVAAAVAVAFKGPPIIKYRLDFGAVPSTVTSVREAAAAAAAAAAVCPPEACHCIAHVQAALQSEALLLLAGFTLDFGYSYRIVAAFTPIAPNSPA